MQIFIPKLMIALDHNIVQLLCYKQCLGASIDTLLKDLRATFLSFTNACTD